MNAAFADNVVFVVYLVIGAVGIALLSGRLLKQWGRKPMKAPQQNRLCTHGTSDALEFDKVIPKIQSLLSSSRPGLRLKNVLVPVDFSESSLRALPYASFLAHQFGCTVTLLYVVHLNLPGEDRGAQVARFEEEMRTAANQTLGAMAPSIGASTRTVVRVGEPVREVVSEVAESDIDIVILGKPRRSGFWQFLIPTVAAKISRRVPCPTLIAA